MKKTKTRTIVRCALIASLYTAVSLVLAPIAFGAVQARVSEAFTLLPVLVPDAVVGVTLGCFLTNLVGVFTGANVLGALDIVFGTAATLTAALCYNYFQICARKRACEGRRGLARSGEGKRL